MDVTIRLDHLADSDPDRLKLFLEHYDVYCVYEEISDKKKKLHYQGWITFPDVKAYNAAKTRFSSWFKDYPGSQKSMAIVKKEEYNIYVVKDKKPFVIKGISEERIKELESKSYKKSDVKDNKKLQTSFQKALDYCKEKGMTSSNDGWEIYEKLTDYYLEECRCEPNTFQLVNMTRSIAKHLMYEQCLKHDTMGAYRSYIRARAIQDLGQTWVQPSDYFSKPQANKIKKHSIEENDGIDYID